MSVPDDVAGVYYELWTPDTERTHPDYVDEDGFRCVGTDGKVFYGRSIEKPERYAKEAIEERKPDGWKVKNHTWLFASANRTPNED